MFGTAGFDMQPPLTCGVEVDPAEALDNPAVRGRQWTVEVALPVSRLLEATTGRAPAPNTWWRINFSRVQWRVLDQAGQYIKDPEYPHEDNWVWSKQGEVAMHLPERWGFLQFTEQEDEEGTGPGQQEWAVRQENFGFYPV